MALLEPFEVEVTLTATARWTIDPQLYGARTAAAAVEMDLEAVREDPHAFLETDDLELGIKIERVTS